MDGFSRDEATGERRTGSGRRRPGIAATIVILSALLLVVAGFSLVATARTVDSLAPVAVRTLGQGGDPRAVVVLVPWGAEDFCPDEFHVTASETATLVTLSAVTRTRVVLPLVSGCAGAGTRDGQAGVYLELAAPLGSREVVRASDGQSLPILNG
jgi:hypothetical protein